MVFSAGQIDRTVAQNEPFSTLAKTRRWAIGHKTPISQFSTGFLQVFYRFSNSTPHRGEASCDTCARDVYARHAQTCVRLTKLGDRAELYVHSDGAWLGRDEHATCTDVRTTYKGSSLEHDSMYTTRILCFFKLIKQFAKHNSFLPCFIFHQFSKNL